VEVHRDRRRRGGGDRRDHRTGRRQSDRAEYQCSAVVGGPGAGRTASRFTLVGRAPQRDNSRTALRRAVPTSRDQQAAAQAGSAPREGTDKALDVGKDAGIGALGGAAVGAAGGAIAGGGKGAGKGALIGGLVGAGGGTLYGIWDNKKNDERFREAYATCMQARGYTG
jgi:hypothetical protein